MCVCACVEWEGKVDAEESRTERATLSAFADGSIVYPRDQRQKGCWVEGTSDYVPLTWSFHGAFQPRSWAVHVLAESIPLNRYRES